MNVLNRGEMNVEAMQQGQGVEPEEGERHPADVERPEPRLRTVTESDTERTAEEEALIDQWLAERQCSGL